MRFQVPQFIGVEDKIFGPLTVRQFIYVAGGAGMIFVVGKFLPIYIAIFVCTAIGLLSLALAFYKVNERPFIFIAESAFKYWMGHKLYIWKKQDKAPVEKQKSQDILNDPLLYVPKLSDSKLKDMTWSLDVTKEASGPITRN